MCSWMGLRLIAIGMEMWGVATGSEIDGDKLAWPIKPADASSASTSGIGGDLFEKKSAAQ